MSEHDAARRVGRRSPSQGPTAARQTSLRSHNLALVLNAVLESPQPPTRAQIAKRLNLTRATVSGLVDTLIEADFITELDPVMVTGAGRPGVPLTTPTARIVAIGVEVQVDRVTVGLTDLGGRHIASETTSGNFRHSDPDAVVEVIEDLTTPVLDRVRTRGCRILGAGFSVPGLTRRGSGEVRFAPNLQWSSVDLFEVIGRHPSWTSTPCVLGNDADVSAMAEAWTRARARGGSTRGQSFLYLAGEVGIGGALIVNGHLLAGQHGWGGEIGHMCLDPDGPECSCGATGCLEQYAGRDAIFRAAGLAVEDDLPTLLAALASGSCAARQAVADAGRMLGLAIANTINLVDVDRIVLGGFLESLHPYLRRDIERELFSRVMAAQWSPLTVEAGQLGRRASAIGAARLVLEQAIADPAAWID